MSIFNPVWVALGHGEVPGPWAMAGGVLVLAAVTTRGVLGAWSTRTARTVSSTD